MVKVREADGVRRTRAECANELVIGRVLKRVMRSMAANARMA